MNQIEDYVKASRDCQDKITEYEKQIFLETQKMNQIKRELKEKQSESRGGCKHIWKYSRNHTSGWRTCITCGIYENIEL
jgi:hypothetical protein|tara:strand:- start:4465 stop:4701 length:237 start_codon:yes stop_codon:yes gene_type:complete